MVMQINITLFFPFGYQYLNRLSCDAATNNNKTATASILLDRTPQREICSTICLGNAADMFTGLPISISQTSIPRRAKQGFLKDSKKAAMGPLHAKTLPVCRTFNSRGTNGTSQLHVVFVSKRGERKCQQGVDTAPVSAGWAGLRL